MIMDCNTAPYNTTYCVRSCTTIHIQHNAQTWALKGCARQSEKAFGPTSAFSSYTPTERDGPTCTFWANLTPVSLRRIPTPAASPSRCARLLHDRIFYRTIYRTIYRYIDLDKALSIECLTRECTRHRGYHLPAPVRRARAEWCVVRARVETQHVWPRLPRNPTLGGLFELQPVPPPSLRLASEVQGPLGVLVLRSGPVDRS